MPTHGIRPNANTVIRPNAAPPIVVLNQFVLKLWIILSGLNLSDANFLLFDIIFHMDEVGLWYKAPFFRDPHPQC